MNLTVLCMYGQNTPYFLEDTVSLYPLTVISFYLVFTILIFSVKYIYCTHIISITTEVLARISITPQLLAYCCCSYFTEKDCFTFDYTIYNWFWHYRKYLVFILKTVITDLVLLSYILFTHFVANTIKTTWCYSHINILLTS